MPSASWDGLVPDTDPEQAVEFMKGWHGALPESAGGGKRWMTITSLPMSRAVGGALTEVLDGLESGGMGLSELTYPADSRKPQGLYHSVGVTKTRPPMGYRGKDRDVDRIPGAWADLDVRPGSFSGWEDVHGLIMKMRAEGIGPNIVVATGSGGAHCYWRAVEGMAPEQAVHYTKRIRRWVHAVHGAKVDNVAQASRIMRLPGSLRFPKGMDDLTRDVVPVGLVTSDRGWTDFEVMERVTKDAWEAVEERTREQRERLATDFYAIEGVALTELEFQGMLPGVGSSDLRTFMKGTTLGGSGMDSDASWDELWSRFAFLEVFNNEVPWAAILEPAGWVRHGEPDDEGRQSWTRPGGGGKNPRSAITDWVNGPNVMSLLSDAPETGLSHLYEIADDATRRVFKLTKSRVAAELMYGGSLENLMAAWLRSHRRTGW